MPAAAASINSFKILGDSFIWIDAAIRPRNGVRDRARGDRTVIVSDATAIVEQVPLVKSMSPNADGHTQVVYGGENWVTMFRGVTPVFLQIRRWNTRLGAFFTEADVDATAPVCVLGQTVVDNLFGQRGSHRQDSTRPQYAGTPLKENSLTSVAHSTYNVSSEDRETELEENCSSGCSGARSRRTSCDN